MDVTHHKLSSQELANYLQRIHLVSPPKATDIDGLKELQIHHLLSIPYENLDPMNGISTSMDSEDLYKKMILHRRGGYCFELQGLFFYCSRHLAITLNSGQAVLWTSPVLSRCGVTGS